MRSMFLELLAQESAIPKGEVRAFSIEGLQAMLQARAAFVHKVEDAFREGSLTDDQRQKLIELNRKNALP